MVDMSLYNRFITLKSGNIGIIKGVSDKSIIVTTIDGIVKIEPERIREQENRLVEV